MSASTAADPTEDSGEIVVTAQKRNEAIESVPISISNISSDKIGPAGVTSLADIPQLVAGVRIDSLGSRLQPTIRGISSNAGGPGQSANVAIYTDGYYQPSQLGNSFDLVDVDSVQVVKGPQGTLFGRNATGGAITINTLAPSHETSVKLLGSYGSYNDASISGFGTTGLTDTLAASVTGYYRRSDGFVTNIVTGNNDAYSKQVLVRGKLLFEPTSALSFTLAVSHSVVDSPAGQVYSLFPPLASQAQPPVTFPGSIVTAERKRTSQNVEAAAHTRINSAYLTSVADLGWASVTSYTGYRDEKSFQNSDLDGSSAAIFAVDWHQVDRTISQEFNLVSKTSSPLQWSAGVFYMNDKAGVLDYNLHYCGTCTLNYIQSDIRTEAMAAYFDGTYNLVGGLFATAGARYSSEEQIYSYTSLGAKGHTERTWDGISPRFALRYEFSPRSSLYASYTRGFKAGTFSTTSPILTPVDQEDVDAYEVGFKWAKSGWRAAVSAYSYDYSNLQITSYNLVAGTRLLQNAAAAKIKGAELELGGKIGSHFTFYANGAYTDGKYKSFPGAVDTVLAASGVGYVNAVKDVSGNRMLRAPEFTGNLGGAFTAPLAGGALNLSANLFATSKIFYDAPNRFGQPGYQILNLTAGWTSPDEHWNLAVFAKNVTDTKYYNYINPLSYAILANWGTPATVGVQLGFKY